MRNGVSEHEMDEHMPPLEQSERQGEDLFDSLGVTAVNAAQVEQTVLAKVCIVTG